MSLRLKVQFLLTFPQYYNISPTSAIAALAEQHANTYFNRPPYKLKLNNPLEEKQQITESKCASNLSH